MVSSQQKSSTDIQPTTLEGFRLSPQQRRLWSLLEEVRKAYRLAETTFPWAEGDILVLDNMLAAHGRRPYVGARSVVVGMA